MKYYIILILAGLFLYGCAELDQNNITPPRVLTVHRPGINDPHSSEFHGNLIRQNSWQMNDCQQCHGINFKGSGKAADCTTCHTGNNGPLACNTCHGTFTSNRIAPPQDTRDSVSTSNMGVGAHVSHLYENNLSTVRCRYCHTLPSGGVYSPGHVDSPLPAEVKFDSISIANIAAGAAVHDYTTGTCSNTYCHGNFEFLKNDAAPERRFAYEDNADKMVGNNKTVLWTKVDNTEAVCGSCHGLPPVGHKNFGGGINQCVACHATVVDGSGNIIDKTKHIDGKVNFGLSK